MSLVRAKAIQCTTPVNPGSGEPRAYAEVRTVQSSPSDPQYIPLYSSTTLTNPHIYAIEGLASPTFTSILASNEFEIPTDVLGASGYRYNDSMMNRTNVGGVNRLQCVTPGRYRFEFSSYFGINSVNILKAEFRIKHYSANGDLQQTVTSKGYAPAYAAYTYIKWIAKAEFILGVGDTVRTYAYNAGSATLFHLHGHQAYQGSIYEYLGAT